jgi:hypothetical protein
LQEESRSELQLGESAMSKLYFFSNNQYARYDINRDAGDSGYPLSVGGYWTGLPTAGIDAAINWGNGYVYFFAGTQYYRFNTKGDQVESGFPLPIAANWTGLNLDAVAGFPPGSVICFPERAGIIDGGFLPGVYCSYVIARQLKGFDSRPVFWVFNVGKYAGGAKASYQNPLPAPEPLLSGIEFSTNWQLDQAVGTVKMLGQTVANIDLDSATVPDPSSIA